MIEKMKGLRTS